MNWWESNVPPSLSEEAWQLRRIEEEEDKADLQMDDLKRKMSIAWNDARRRNLRRRMQKLEQRMKAIHSRKLAWKLANG